MAYLCLLPFWRGKLFCDNARDELMMLLLGVSGGSLYFLLENSALLYTQASNVAIIIAATPLLTTLAVQFVSRQEQASKRFYAYSLLAMAGVALVVFNGEFILKLNPLGDLLTLGASIMWVIYSIAFLKMEGRYHPLMITRKIFFYGVLTLAPYMFYEGWDITWAAFANPVVVGNLLFLGIVASLICYWSWNMVLEKLGAIKATNYLYLNPIVALITSWIVLDERITALALLGTALILTGMYMAQKK
jgi:drug/metabolite transporter (DMT)-like permease